MEWVVCSKSSKPADEQICMFAVQVTDNRFRDDARYLVCGYISGGVLHGEHGTFPINTVTHYLPIYAPDNCRHIE